MCVHMRILANRNKNEENRKLENTFPFLLFVQYIVCQLLYFAVLHQTDNKTSISKISYMVKTYGSRSPPSPNLDKAIISFDKFDQYWFISSITWSLYSTFIQLKGGLFTWPNQDNQMNMTENSEHDQKIDNDEY